MDIYISTNILENGWKYIIFVLYPVIYVYPMSFKWHIGLVRSSRYSKRHKSNNKNSFYNLIKFVNSSFKIEIIIVLQNK